MDGYNERTKEWMADKVVDGYNERTKEWMDTMSGQRSGWIQ